MYKHLCPFSLGPTKGNIAFYAPSTSIPTTTVYAHVAAQGVTPPWPEPLLLFKWPSNLKPSHLSRKLWADIPMSTHSGRLPSAGKISTEDLEWGVSEMSKLLPEKLGKPENFSNANSDAIEKARKRHGLNNPLQWVECSHT